ncbi:MAG: CBS domain-containing protein [Dehalococcoidia bacterium]
MDSRVAGAARNVIICPDCRAENIEGTDVCIVCGTDLRNLSAATSELESRLMHDKLKDIGAREALAVALGDPVSLAIHFMRQHKTECVLVRDAHGDIVGILTERDILLKAAGPNVDLMALAVKDIMTKDPVMLRQDDSLAVALHKMSVGGFRHIPFVSDDGMTLLVSIQDVFHHVAALIPHH